MCGARSSINMENHKQWWAPIWTGLVMDPEAKHYRRMKNAIWLFLYLVLNANRETGLLLRKVKTISSDMNVHRNTVFRWLNILRKQRYITTENTGRCLHIQIKKWKGTAEIQKVELQKQRTRNPKNTKGGTSLEGMESQKTPILRGNSAFCSPPNDITIKKDILNIDIDSKDFLDSPLKISKRFKPTNRQQLLALDLARELNDCKGLPFYLSCTKKYPESLLRKVLGRVKEVPSEKITKSRAALFNHMIQKYDQKDSQNFSH